MDENTRKQMVFEASRKSVGIAYLLWFFLGFFGVHRFYAGRTGSGIAQLLLCLSVVGWLVLIPWLLVDIVLIPGMVRDENMKTISMLSSPEPSRPAKPARPAEPAQVLQSEAERKREEMLEDLRQTGYKKERRDINPLYR